MVWSVRLDDEEHETERSDGETESTTCSEFESGKIVQHSSQGEQICEECGLVIEDELVDSGPEWRAFNHQERQEKSRVDAPITNTIHDEGLTTQIEWKDKDAYGRAISSNALVAKIVGDS